MSKAADGDPTAYTDFVVWITQFNTMLDQRWGIEVYVKGRMCYELSEKQDSLQHLKAWISQNLSRTYFATKTKEIRKHLFE